MKKHLALLLLSILAASCHSYTCNDLTDTFPPGKTAIQRVRGSTFHFTDEFALSDTGVHHRDAIVDYVG